MYDKNDYTDTISNIDSTVTQLDLSVHFIIALSLEDCHHITLPLYFLHLLLSFHLECMCIFLLFMHL